MSGTGCIMDIGGPDMDALCAKERAQRSAPIQAERTIAKKLYPGMVLRHHSGRVYTVTGISNTAHLDAERVPEVVLLGANGNLWVRPITSIPGKFSVIFDGRFVADVSQTIYDL